MGKKLAEMNGVKHEAEKKNLQKVRSLGLWKLRQQQNPPLQKRPTCQPKTHSLWVWILSIAGYLVLLTGQTKRSFDRNILFKLNHGSTQDPKITGALARAKTRV